MADASIVRPAASLRRDLLRFLAPFSIPILTASVLGAVSGLATAWMLSTINRALYADGLAEPHLLLSFAGLCIVTLIGRAVAGVSNSVVGQKIIAALRKDISARILRVPVATIERYESHRLLSILNGDIDTISALTFNISGYVIACAVILGCLAYLVILSPILFVLVFVTLSVNVLLHFVTSRRWQGYYDGVRIAQDDLQHQYRAIVEGAKELRLSRDRRKQVHETLLSSAADRISALKIEAMKLYWSADAVGSTLFFFCIGALLVLRQPLGIPNATTSGFVLVLLYMRGPIDLLLSVIPVVAQAAIAFGRIADLSGAIASHPVAEPERVAVPALSEALELRQASYRFDDAPGGGFTLGPVDLTVPKGTTLFIVGENGSGKTTLIKLLLGLYSPTSGSIAVDGVVFSPDQMAAFGEQVSAVFSDYFLFTDLPRSDAESLARARQHLERLEIAHKVSITETAFSTTKLSTGQRKRLALVHAYLEQRPVMLFDEWAADQDPTFRRIFYTEILPELKQQGRTVIVVSHDDRYFEAADQIVRLKNGRLVAGDTPEGAAAGCPG